MLALALSAVLTFGLHNQDTYLTGFWDDYSQALVFARMLQMQQDQQSPGGFLGTYTEEFGDTQNRYLYRENTPVEPEDYHAYTHQTGLQGWALGILNKVFSIWQDSGEARERMLYATNSILFYAAALALAWAAGRAYGAPAGVGWALAAVLAPWVQRGMKDLYWCLWTWLLPMLAGALLCAVTRRRGRTPWYCYALCFAAPMLRCMCGFEFISTFLILGEIPLFACWAAALAEGKGPRPGSDGCFSPVSRPSPGWRRRLASGLCRGISISAAGAKVSQTPWPRPSSIPAARRSAPLRSRGGIFLRPSRCCSSARSVLRRGRCSASGPRRLRRRLAFASRATAARRRGSGRLRASGF